MFEISESLIHRVRHRNKLMDVTNTETQDMFLVAQMIYLRNHLHNQGSYTLLVCFYPV